jgi:iron complex outermembrane recepter protein
VPWVGWGRVSIRSCPSCVPACRALPALAFGAVTLPVTALAQTAEVTLPEVSVIGTSPLSTVRSARPSGSTARPTRRAAGPPATAPVTAPAPVPTTAADAGMIDRNKVPSNTVTLTAQDFDHSRSTSLADSLLQRVPSVYINDTSVNPFQPDVQYRGFVASPTVGVPQGLAVYQNGVRVNESFGDTVNWDFIPEYAIRRLDVFPSNPVFGLNALGGAISIEMKNGFNYQGREIELLGGSNWRRSAMAQVGIRQGNTSFYVAADALNDNGWRDRSPSELRRAYADVGVLGDRAEFHVNFTGASNFFGAAAATPIQMLNQSALELGLHHAADHEEPARLPEYDLQLSGERHAFDQEQRLLPRLLAEARGWQHQRCRALRSGLVPGTPVF